MSLAVTDSVWEWIHRLGGPGLILLGLADNAPFVSAPAGSVDVFVILLSAHRPQWWAYYAIMATVGEVLGGYLTYRLAKKGGQETLEKKVGKPRGKTLYVFRETRAHNGAHRLYPTAAIPFHLRPDGRRCHAISAQEVLVRTDSRACRALLCRSLFGQDLWPANDWLLLTALQAYAVCPDRAGGDGRLRRPDLF